MKKVYKTLIIISLIGLILPNSPLFAQEEGKLGKKAIEALKNLPNIFLNIIKEDILPFWKKLWNWFLEHIWQRIVDWVKGKPEEELKERVEIGIEEEKKELEKELEQEKKNLWQKFLDWLKGRWLKR